MPNEAAQLPTDTDTGDATSPRPPAQRGGKRDDARTDPATVAVSIATKAHGPCWLTRADVCAVVATTTPDRITQPRGSIRNWALVGNTAWPVVPLVRAALPGDAEPHGPVEAAFALECLGFTTLRRTVYSSEGRPVANTREEQEVSGRVVAQGRAAARKAELRPRQVPTHDGGTPWAPRNAAPLTPGETAAVRALLAQRALQPES